MIERPLLSRTRLEEALATFLARVSPTCRQSDYRLVGTCASLLHGVPLAVGDIDILVKDRHTVDALGAALSSLRCLRLPNWLPEALQYYGNYEINGVELQISTVEVASGADTIETYGRGPWRYFTILHCGGYAVPTVALELRLLTELRRNRPDRYHPLIVFLQKHGCDTHFIRRGMEAAGLPQAVHDQVLEGLKEAPFRMVAEQGGMNSQGIGSAHDRSAGARG